MSAPARSPIRIRWATRAAPAAGDVQVMSAGTGVRHAEYNLEDEATTLFQIWVLTDKPSAEPELGRGEIPEGRPRRAGSSRWRAASPRMATR